MNKPKPQIAYAPVRNRDGKIATNFIDDDETRVTRAFGEFFDAEFSGWGRHKWRIAKVQIIELDEEEKSDE